MLKKVTRRLARAGRTGEGRGRVRLPGQRPEGAGPWPDGAGGPGPVPAAGAPRGRAAQRGRSPAAAALAVTLAGLAGWGLLLKGGLAPPAQAGRAGGHPAGSYWALTHAPRIAGEPTSGLMVGVYTADLARFDRAIGRRASLSVCYLRWGSRFPAVTVVRAAALHAETIIEIEPDKDGFPTARQIARGAGDAWLRTIGGNIAAYGDPVTVSFEPEMNGPWHSRPWHEDPAGYVAAFRRVHAILSRTAGGPWITWLWQPSAIHLHTPDPMPWWPGSRYVDVIGLDGYFYSPQDTFSSIFARTIGLIRRRTALPILVGETAAGPLTGHQARDIAGLFAGIRASHLLGLVWYDQRQDNPPYHQDWRLEDSPAALAAFRTALSGAGPLAAFPRIGPRR